MVAVSLETVTHHARRRLAQRNLSMDDAAYVIAHGSVTFSGHARFVHLGWRDIPDSDRRDDRIRRLEGTILVFDSESGGCLTTAYRNRTRGLKDIRRKPKRAFTSEPPRRDRTVFSG
ncbi:MAG TPA: DUF4258 domain-containing protein [Thermomicrobiales bacterium]|jgi:hypothetical protein|nr:DUF4258 domain-containing protein [Thermomicrobiales bacterium]